MSLPDAGRQFHHNLGIPFIKIMYLCCLSPHSISQLYFAWAGAKEKTQCVHVEFQKQAAQVHYAKVKIQLSAWHNQNSVTLDPDTFSHIHPWN